MTDPARFWRWALLGVICCAFLAIDVILPHMWFTSEYLIGLLLGILVAQVNLIATWAALAPGNVMFRLPWAWLLTTLSWYALVVGCRMAGPFFQLDDAALLGVVLYAGVVVVQVPLWVARWKAGWRLIGFNATPATDAGRWQFELRHMLVATALLAAALAPMRWVLPHDELDSIPLEADLLILLGGLAVYNLLATVPCIWGAFLTTVRPGPVAATWLAHTMLLTVVEFGVFCALLGSPGSDALTTLMVMWLMNVAQGITVLAVLLPLRAVGMRMQRVGRTTTRPGAGKEPTATDDGPRGAAPAEGGGPASNPASE